MLDILVTDCEKEMPYFDSELFLQHLVHVDNYTSVDLNGYSYVFVMIQGAFDKVRATSKLLQDGQVLRSKTLFVSDCHRSMGHRHAQPFGPIFPTQLPGLVDGHKRKRTRQFDHRGPKKAH